MYINRISEDDWIGVFSNSVEYQCNTLEELTQAIHRLNGQNKTMITLKSDDNDFLTIAGGNEGRYICYVTIGVDDTFVNLVNSCANDQDLVEIVAGGQLGIFKAKQCTDLSTVLQAASYFACYGKTDPSLAWEVSP